MEQKQTFKEKVKRFWKEHETEIVVCGLGALTIASISYRKGYNNGVFDGAVIGFHETCKWLDENFPDESKAVELFERFSNEHPDQISYRSIRVKRS